MRRPRGRKPLHQRRDGGAAAEGDELRDLDWQRPASPALLTGCASVPQSAGGPWMGLAARGLRVPRRSVVASVVGALPWHH
eukprot:6637312-Pyramimonas_sp.AAC.1